MKTVDILQNLTVFQKLLDDLHSKETERLQHKPGFVQLVKSISNQYSFITLRLGLRTESASDRSEYSEKIYCQISFEISANTIVFKELYHESATDKEALTIAIMNNSNVNQIAWHTAFENTFYHGEETMRYLDIADEIASSAFNCTSGDDYYPGYFSEIQQSDGMLKLSQTNHMNSRSLQHKADYTLRKLEFFIPLKEDTEEKPFYDYEIGKMKIYFRDSSSANKKACGDAILIKIEEALAKYKS